MLTIDSLKEYGAAVQEGLNRCMNNETFYLRLVKMAVEDGNFAKLEDAVRRSNLKEAFEAAHALKGVLSNLALTPILDPVLEITEQLRAGEERDYTAAVSQILEKRELLRSLING